MTAQALLQRLDGVKQTAPDRWLAKCPAHQDKRASLSVRELADGRVLVHDFGGCGVDDVLGAVGLEMAELFPERIEQHSTQKAPRIPAADILQAVAHEVEVVAIAANQIEDGDVLNDEDRSRFRLAVSRLRKAATVANGR